MATRLPANPPYHASFGQGAAAAGNAIVVGGGGLFLPISGGALLFAPAGEDWIVESTLTPGVSGGNFGYSAAMTASVIVIGAPTAYNDDVIDGRAYAFERNAAGEWPITGVLIADRPDPDPVRAEFFGHAVATDGQRILVGAYNNVSAYIFERDAAGQWVQTTRLAPTDGHGRYFGYSVAIDGDLAVVGARDDFERVAWGGSAYVFRRQPDGVWIQVDKLFASEVHTLDGFGYAVAIHDGAILVGSEAGRIGPPSAGAVYVFEPDGAGRWTETQKFNPPAASDGEQFGRAIAVDANLLVVGSQGFAGASRVSGGAFVYQRQPDRTWRNIGILAAPDGQDFDRFGYSVAISGSHAVVGAPYRDQDGVEDAGAAYVFHISRDDDGDGAMNDCQCDCDANFDGVVGLTDLAFLLADFDRTGPDVGRVHGDFDNDRDVDLSDLARLLARFGSECP